MNTANKVHLRSVPLSESGETIDKEQAQEACVVGYEEYRHLTRVLKLEAVLDFGVGLQVLTTYKPVGLATGWFWRDNKFHMALGDISTKSILAGGGGQVGDCHPCRQLRKAHPSGRSVLPDAGACSQHHHPQAGQRSV